MYFPILILQIAENFVHEKKIIQIKKKKNRKYQYEFDKNW